MASTPAAKQSYFSVDLTQPSALVIGSEKNGLTNFWLKNADQQVLIPMAGAVNSLNASVSAALLTYEAVRQRKDI